MQYAVIETGGKQYKINKGEIVDVDNLNLEQGNTITFDKVLLVVSDGAVEIGMPYVENATVAARVVDSIKGEKVRSARYRAKSHYRRVTGFRPNHTRIEISDIKVDTKKQKETKKAKKE